MKVNEIKELSPTELLQKEKELREELFNMRFQHHTGQLEKTSRFAQLKRDIARVLTILNERKQKA
jgi:large subunit ribosomal protein L29